LQHQLPFPPARALARAPVRRAFPSEPRARLAAELTRGVVRLLHDLGYRTLTEMRLASGRRADALGLDRRGRFALVEVKSTTSDFRADDKWPDYLPACDAFYFAVGMGFPHDILPPEAGIMVADRHGAEVVRPAPRRPMTAPARARQTLLFAHTAGGRLNAFELSR